MRQALEMALEWIEKQPEETPHSKYDLDTRYVVIKEIEAALAQPEQEPVKIAHRHEWFRTGEMKVGQMRCISCGAWSQEEITQRTWVGLTDEEITTTSKETHFEPKPVTAFARAIEAKLKDKNERISP